MPPVLPRRRFAGLLLAGLVLRLMALPLPGTGDVLIWKTWSYNAVVSGETTLYGVGSRVPELVYRHLPFAVDYPPVSLYALGVAGRAYHALAPDMPDTAWFTAAVKVPPLLAEAALTVLLFLAGRRMAGESAGRALALAYWLNPAVLLVTAALGYLDPLFALPAVGALIAAAAGRTWASGALLAAAALTKAQGVLVAPVVAMAVVAATPRDGARWWTLAALRVGETAAGAALAAVGILFPFAAAGSLGNVAAAMRTLAEHDMLSGQAANVWWLVTWLLRAFDALPDVGAWRAFTMLPGVLAISRAVELGYPNPRVVGLVLMSAAWLWALWRQGRATDLALLAGSGAFLVHSYFVLAAQVHENHLYLAIPLAVVAAVGRPSWRGVAFGLTVVQTLNLYLFYGFSQGAPPLLDIPRSVTGVDAVVVLSVANVALLAWHARVLYAQRGLSAGALRAETGGWRGPGRLVLRKP
jgi:hypothetical protein